MTSPAPSGIRWTDEDRARLDRLALFWGTDSVTALVRRALEGEDLLLMAFQAGPDPFAFEVDRRKTRFEEQYESRMRKLKQEYDSLRAEREEALAVRSYR